LNHNDTKKSFFVFFVSFVVYLVFLGVLRVRQRNDVASPAAALIAQQTSASPPDPSR
jgi:hypothetical protein